MESRKVLIITYYWPPSGGPGVQRWLKFTKYLREFGWEPIIYTAENPEAPEIDRSLEKDIPESLRVIRRRIWEPYHLYKFFIGQSQKTQVNQAFLSDTQKPKTTEIISRWIRGNFFIPDARKFWIKPSIKFLSKWLGENPVDVMVSTGPPHSMHMIGRGLQEATGIPWLADFRDPWTNIDYYDDLLPGTRANRLHHKLEAEVVTKADRVVTVSPTWKKELEAVHIRSVDLLTNGYDEDDFEGVNPEQDPFFSISHIGTLMPSRNPVALWDALSQLVRENENFARDFRLVLVGRVDFSVKEALREYGLNDNLIETGYLPHNEVIKRQKSTWVLLDILKKARNTKGLYAGKIFEYLAAKRPILIIGPQDSDAAKLIKKLKAGYAVGFDDVHSMKERIRSLYSDYRQNGLASKSIAVEQFSRRNLTSQLSGILSDMIKG
ncbi:MAG: glycosyltransferase family 4 protein [Balneolales bacterium]